MNKTDYLTGRHLLVQSQNGYTRTMCEICSNLTIKIEEWSHWHRSGVFLLTLNMFQTLFCYGLCWLWTSKCQLEKRISYDEHCF